MPSTGTFIAVLGAALVECAIIMYEYHIKQLQYSESDAHESLENLQKNTEKLILTIEGQREYIEELHQEIADVQRLYGGVDQSSSSSGIPRVPSNTTNFRREESDVGLEEHYHHSERPVFNPTGAKYTCLNPNGGQSVYRVDWGRDTVGLTQRSTNDRRTEGTVCSSGVQPTTAETSTSGEISQEPSPDCTTSC